MAVTPEQVCAAADQIAAEGGKPTLAAVREITGGSYTTISPALRDWRAKQAASSPPATRDPVPEKVADRMADLAAEVWAAAQELASSRLSAEREALEHARTELDAERNEAVELADRLAGEVEELTARLATAAEAQQQQTAAAEALREDLASARAQVGVAEARVEDLRQEVAAARQEAATAREEAARLAGRLEAAEGILSRLELPGAEPPSGAKKGGRS